MDALSLCEAGGTKLLAGCSCGNAGGCWRASKLSVSRNSGVAVGVSYNTTTPEFLLADSLEAPQHPPALPQLQPASNSMPPASLNESASIEDEGLHVLIKVCLALSNWTPDM